MNEAFDSTSFQVVGEWADQAGARMQRGARCDYSQGPGESENGEVGVNVLRQEPPDPLYLDAAVRHAALGCTNGTNLDPGTHDEERLGRKHYRNRIVRAIGHMFWMVIAYDNTSGISFDGLNTIAEYHRRRHRLRPAVVTLQGRPRNQ